MTLRERLFGKKTKMYSARVAMCGLDAAGKTTITNYLRLGTSTQTIPTLGVNFETIRYKNFELNIWDLGGQVSFRGFWQRFVSEADIVCYVIDMSDHERLEESAREFERVVEEHAIVNCPVLVIANKSDKENLLEPAQIIKEFGLNQARFLETTWHLQITSAKTGSGIVEAFTWLYEQVTGEKPPMPVSIRDIAIFSELGENIAQTKGPTFKDPELTAGFFAALEQFAQHTIDHNLDSLIIGKNKIVFERVKELLGAIVMNVEGPEMRAKDILSNLIREINEKGEDNAQEVLEDFIKRELKDYMKPRE
ncbi:MAG: ADP-ribosylation factor family protein [Candidatus Hodarchaeota archaeon]